MVATSPQGAHTHTKVSIFHFFTHFFTAYVLDERSFLKIWSRFIIPLTEPRKYLFGSLNATFTLVLQKLIS